MWHLAKAFYSKYMERAKGKAQRDTKERLEEEKIKEGRTAPEECQKWTGIGCFRYFQVLLTSFFAPLFLLLPTTAQKANL